MTKTYGAEIRRAVLWCCVAAAVPIGFVGASAQTDPGQQAAAQTQQQQLQQQMTDATRMALEANQQAAQAAQQANQQAMQRAQAAAASTRGPLPRRGYGRADKPTFTPRPGSFSGPVRLTMSDPGTPRSEIYYTLDGSEPTVASARYTGPVLVSSSTKVRAIARSPLYSKSRVATGRYVIR